MIILLLSLLAIITMGGEDAKASTNRQAVMDYCVQRLSRQTCHCINNLADAGYSRDYIKQSCMVWGSKTPVTNYPIEYHQ